MPRDEALAKARDLLELVDLPADADLALSAPVLRRPAPAPSPSPARWRSIPTCWSRTKRFRRSTSPVQAQVLELLDEIQTRLGIALLFITHDLRVAAQICDDVAVMQHGRIVEQGPAAQVLTNPQQAYTRNCSTPPRPGMGFCELPAGFASCRGTA